MIMKVENRYTFNTYHATGVSRKHVWNFISIFGIITMRNAFKKVRTHMPGIGSLNREINVNMGRRNIGQKVQNFT